MQASVLVFPAPFAPRRATISPSPTCRDTSRTARTGPYRAVSPSTTKSSRGPFWAPRVSFPASSPKLRAGDVLRNALEDLDELAVSDLERRDDVRRVVLARALVADRPERPLHGHAFRECSLDD